MAEHSPILIARFWSKVGVGSPGACWPWKGGTSNAGYGRFKVGGKLVLAHRFAYELVNGPIPESDSYHGTVCRHQCDNPKCVNPAHIKLGTMSDNMVECVERGRHGAKQGAGIRLPAATVAAVLNDPRPQRAVGRALGISHSTVQRIRAGTRRLGPGSPSNTGASI